MTQDHFTYRVTWCPEDGEHVGLCAEFPSLSWLAAAPEGALAGIRKVVAESVRDTEVNGEKVPAPIAGASCRDDPDLACPNLLSPRGEELPL